MTDIASVESFDEALVAFFLGCQDIYNRHIMRLRKGTPAEHSTDLPQTVWKLDCSNPRYAKIWRNQTVHCFVDRLSGDVYRPDSNKRPAPHVRGNILDKHRGLEHMTPFGPATFWDIRKSA